MSIITNNVMDVNDDLAKAVAAATTPEALNAAVKSEFDRQVAAATAAETQTAVDAKAAADAQTAKTAADAEAAKTAEAAKVAAVTTPTLLTRTEIVGGVEMEFTGATDAEIDKNIINAFKVAAAVRQPEQRQETAVDPSVAAQAAADAAAAKAAATAELELKFKRGEIGTTEFIEQSGAVKEYLEKQGIPLEALRASVEREQGKVYEQSWAEATSDFLKTPLGSTWPGGDRNQHMIGVQLAALGLTDATDKVAAIAQAYKAMQDLKLVFPGEKEEKAAREAAENKSTITAPSAADAAAAAAATAKAAADAAAAEAAKQVKQAPTASAMFGASSGLGATGETNAGKTQEPLIAVPPDATPEQILEAWKAAQVKAGIHPNDAFRQQFSGKRA